MLVSMRYLEAQPWYSRVIVDLDLRECCHHLRRQTQTQVAATITGGGSQSPEFLDPRHHNSDKLAEEMIHIFSFKICCHADHCLASGHVPFRFAYLSSVRGDSDIGDCLYCHTRNMDLSCALPSRSAKRVHSDSLNHWNIRDRDRLPQQPQNISTTRST